MLCSGEWNGVNDMSEKHEVIRNNAFEFYRFLFSAIIFILHFWGYGNFESRNGRFQGGYLAVEFFFMLSGFMMMEKIPKISGGECELSAVKYFVLRLKRLMPQYWASLAVLLLIGKLIIPDFNLKKCILKGFPEIFSIQIFLTTGKINYQLWFVSALLWAGALAYYLLLKKTNFFAYIVFPIGLFIFCGYTYKNVGHIALIDNGVIFLGGFFRALFEIGFGGTIYLIYKKMKHYKYPYWIMSILEIGLIVVILIIMWRSYLDYKDFLMVFLIGGHILVTALNRGCISRFMQNHRFPQILGSISYPFYLNSLTFQQIAVYKFPGLPFWPVAIALILVTAGYAYILIFISNYFSQQRKSQTGKNNSIDI